MKQPLVSIILPVYNVADYLPRCLDSVLSQSYTSLEVIAVDDGSTDNSGTILDGYAARDSRVKPIHKANGGVSAARNTGLDTARGEYVLFLDSDDWLEPHTVQVLVAAAADCDLVQAAHVVSYDDGTDVIPCEIPDRMLRGREEIFTGYFYNTIQEACWNKLFRRSLLQTVRFDPRLAVAEDSKFVYEVLQQATSVQLLSAVTYHYFERGDSCTHQRMQEKHFDVLRLRDRQAEDLAQDTVLTEAFIYKYAGDVFHVINGVLKDDSDRFSDRLPQLRQRLMQIRSQVFRHPAFSKAFKLGVALLWLAPPVFYVLYRNFRKNG